MIAEKQYEDEKYAGSYNIGPSIKDCITIGELTTIFCKKWGENLTWKTQSQNGPHEAKLLKLDCTKIKNTFNLSPRWNIEKAIEKTIEFTKFYQNNKDIKEIMNKQIKEYMEK